MLIHSICTYTFLHELSDKVLMLETSAKKLTMAAYLYYQLS